MSNLSLTHQKLFHRARILAVHGEHRVRVGCVVARKSKPLAGAFNTARNEDSLVEFHEQTWHAEVNCLKMLRYEHILNGGLTLYVCRIDQKGIPRASKPCRRCIEFIKEQNAVTRIVYWDDDTSNIQILKL